MRVIVSRWMEPLVSRKQLSLCLKYPAASPVSRRDATSCGFSHPVSDTMSSVATYPAYLPVRDPGRPFVGCFGSRNLVRVCATSRSLVDKQMWRSTRGRKRGGGRTGEPG
jgi:hypothetical protein